ncbi:MAG: hypothetical protein GVY14_05365 [Spirochaetes bacterium]|jgi:hypothetical protein|nr:hypothetical protein [Spirochaetota bacterium]
MRRHPAKRGEHRKATLEERRGVDGRLLLASLVRVFVLRLPPAGAPQREKAPLEVPARRVCRIHGCGPAGGSVHPVHGRGESHAGAKQQSRGLSLTAAQEVNVDLHHVPEERLGLGHNRGRSHGRSTRLVRPA